MVAGLIVGPVSHRPAQSVQCALALSQRMAGHTQIVPRHVMSRIEQEGAAIGFGGGFGEPAVEQDIAEIVPAVPVGRIDRQQAAIAQDRRFPVAGGSVERREAEPCGRVMGM